MGKKRGQIRARQGRRRKPGGQKEDEGRLEGQKKKKQRLLDIKKRARLGSQKKGGQASIARGDIPKGRVARHSHPRTCSKWRTKRGGDNATGGRGIVSPNQGRRRGVRSVL